MKSTCRILFIVFFAILFSCTVKPGNETASDSTKLAADTVTASVNDGPEEDEIIPETEDPAIGEDGEPYGEPQAIQCTFLGYEEGDCPHLNFSCGDFGIAITDALPEKELELWLDLTVVDDEKGTIANPDYVGQKFTIVHNQIEGWPCQAGYPETSLMEKGEIPHIVKFSMN